MKIPLSANSHGNSKRTVEQQENQTRRGVHTWFRGGKVTDIIAQIRRGAI